MNLFLKSTFRNKFWNKRVEDGQLGHAIDESFNVECSNILYNLMICKVGVQIKKHPSSFTVIGDRTL